MAEQKTKDIKIAVVVNSDGEWNCGPFYAEPDLDRVSLGIPRTQECFYIVKATVPIPERIAAVVPGTAEPVGEES